MASLALSAGIVGSAIAPAVHADAASLKKLLEEARAKEAPVAESAPLTQSDIDKLLPALPALQQALERIDPPEPTKEQQKGMSIAMMEGRPYGAMSGYFESLPQFSEMNDEAASLGFAGYADYANRADGVMKVLTAEQWILAARNITRDNEPKPEPIDNLWLYIRDENVDLAEREKLSTQLDEMLEKLHSTQADAKLVYENIDEIRPVFQP